MALATRRAGLRQCFVILVSIWLNPTCGFDTLGHGVPLRVRIVAGTKGPARSGALHLTAPRQSARRQRPGPDVSELHPARHWYRFPSMRLQKLQGGQQRRQSGRFFRSRCVQVDGSPVRQILTPRSAYTRMCFSTEPRRSNCAPYAHQPVVQPHAPDTHSASPPHNNNEPFMALPHKKSPSPREVT